jgi:hypothetical protein
MQLSGTTVEYNNIESYFVLMREREREREREKEAEKGHSDALSVLFILHIA